MLGFSLYLENDLTAEDYNYLIAMRNAGFTTVFTSLLVENDVQVNQRLIELVKWCKNLDLYVVADVSATSFQKINVDFTDVGQVQSLGLSGLRIDNGIPMKIIAKLSKSMLIALNASTISTDDLLELKENNAAFDHLQAWHNYYPRPETGVSEQWLKERNHWLHAHGLKVAAFAAGNTRLRPPFLAGMPTLEVARQENPLAATLLLKQLACDMVFIGDPGLQSTTITSFQNYLKHQAITLHLDQEIDLLKGYVWHNRSDVARDVVRLQEARSRQLFDTTPAANTARQIGTLTCDNDLYLNYRGELQITRRDLPADPKVNVLARIISTDIALLDFIGAKTKIIFA